MFLQNIKNIAIVLWQLTDISDDGYLCLMADNGELREDLKIPDGDLGTQLRADYESGKELLVSICFYIIYMIYVLVNVSTCCVRYSNYSIIQNAIVNIIKL